MVELLDSRAKSIPSNYSIQGSFVDTDEGVGASLTDEQWAKARRQEETDYWDHIESAQEMISEWDKLLKAAGKF